MKPKTLHCGFVENTLHSHWNFLLKYYHGAEQGFIFLTYLERSFCSRYAWRTGWRNLYRRQQWFYCPPRQIFYSKGFLIRIYWIHRRKTQTNNNYCSSVIRSVDGGYLLPEPVPAIQQPMVKLFLHSVWIQNDFNETGCRKEYQMVLCLWRKLRLWRNRCFPNKWWHPDNR